MMSPIPDVEGSSEEEEEEATVSSGGVLELQPRPGPSSAPPTAPRKAARDGRRAARETRIDTRLSTERPRAERCCGGMSRCARVCCGFLAGALTVALLGAFVAFFVLFFAVPYTSIESGVCRKNWVGVQRVCLGVVGKNASDYQAVKMCEAAEAEVVDLSAVQTLIDALGTFAPSAGSDFMGVVRVSGSKIACVRATASGPAAVECPAQTTVVCQHPRPLGGPASFIRAARVFLGLETRDFYERLYSLAPRPYRR